MKKYLYFKTTGDLKKDIELYFLLHDRLDTYEHTLNVVSEYITLRNNLDI